MSIIPIAILDFTLLLLFKVIAFSLLSFIFGIIFVVISIVISLKDDTDKFSITFSYRLWERERVINIAIAIVRTAIAIQGAIQKRSYEPMYTKQIQKKGKEVKSDNLAVK